MVELTIEQKKALALARARVKAGVVNRKGLTGIMGGVEQLGAGLNEGIAGFAGAPVDMATALLTRQRPQFTDTTDYANFDGKVTAAPAGMTPGIEAPFMGSGMTTDIMDPLISDRAPGGMAERYLRRGGQELGFGIPAAMTGAAIPGFGAPARANMPVYMATSAAGDVGAAIGGQTAQELAPGNQTLDFLASVLGGVGAGYGASRLTPETVPVQSLDDLKQGNASDWAKVKASPDTLDPAASARLSPELAAMLQKKRATNPNLFPRANATVDDIAALPPKSLYEVEEARRLAGRNVAANADEAEIGVQMKKTIEEYLSSLGPNDVRGVADPEATIDLMRKARKDSHQVFKAEEITNKEMRGETRAATTGTGGNEVNATKQNIRTVFDRERDPTLRGKSGGYTPDEMAAMERVVMGTPAQNLARLVGRMAPTSGALPMMATGWGGAAGLAGGLSTGNPLMAIPALAGGLGFIGKAAVENMTQREIDRLIATITNGGKAPAQSAARAAANRAVLMQLVPGALGGQPQ
jgi:hypothetical protein